MASLIDTAVATSHEVPTTAQESPIASQSSNSTEPAPTGPTRKKYRHTFAVHSQPRNSCLSHDSTESPSFLGFRNLGALVISQ